MLRKRRQPTRPDGSESQLLAEYSALYQAIGEGLNDVLPPGWSKSWILTEMGADDSMLVGAVTMGDSPVLQFPDLPGEIFTLFRQMYTTTLTLGPPNGVWTMMTFNLDAQGHLEVGYGYDARPVEGRFERIGAWCKAIEATLR